MLFKITDYRALGNKLGEVHAVSQESNTYVIKFHHIKKNANGRRECQCVVKVLITDELYQNFLKNPVTAKQLQVVKNEKAKVENKYLILATDKAVSIEKSFDSYCKAIGREISLKKCLNKLHKVNPSVYDGHFISAAMKELYKQCPHGTSVAKQVMTKEYLQDSRPKEAEPKVSVAIILPDLRVPSDNKVRSAPEAEGKTKNG